MITSIQVVKRVNLQSNFYTTMNLNFYSFLSFVLFFFTLSCNSDDSVSTESPNILSGANRILSFELSHGNQIQSFPINNQIIQGNVDDEVDLNNIELNVSISDNASISPNPDYITSINGILYLTVTAENGESREYTVDISRVLSDENSINQFQLETKFYSTIPEIDENNQSINQRLPQDVDLTSIDASVELSAGATIHPDPENFSDFSQPVNFTVTSESGIERNYLVTVEHMTEYTSRGCDTYAVTKWFGGDNRTDAPDVDPYDRNVGTGQKISSEFDLHAQSFSVRFNQPFSYSEGELPFDEDLELRLKIRNEFGVLLKTTTTNIPGKFTGGFVQFDLSEEKVFLEGGEIYIFQWYLMNGEELGVNSGSVAVLEDNSQEGFCYLGGYSGTAKLSESTTLEDFSSWYEHEWNFNVKLNGFR